MKNLLLVLAVAALATVAQAAVYNYDSSVPNWYGAGGFTAAKGDARIVTNQSVTNQIMAIYNQPSIGPVYYGDWGGAFWNAPEGEVVTQVTVSGYYRSDAGHLGYGVFGGTGSCWENNYLGFAQGAPLGTPFWGTWTRTINISPAAAATRFAFIAWWEGANGPGDYEEVVPYGKGIDDTYYGAITSVQITTVNASPYKAVLLDNFNISSPPSDDENAELSTRQSGTGAPDEWEDLGQVTQGTDLDGRISINANNQLEIDTGAGSNEYLHWITGQSDLEQSRSYRVSWDQGAQVYDGFDYSWSFVQINHLGKNSGPTCGFMVSSTNWVTLYVDGVPNTYSLQYTPTGPNGLHHFDVVVKNGYMTATVDGVSGWDFNFNTATDPCNTKGAGIGVFRFFTFQLCTGYLDNFKYYKYVPISIEPSNGSTTVVEGGATDTYTVSLLAAPSSNVTVSMSDTSSPAQVTLSPSVLTFTTANWNVPQVVTVTAVDDTVLEGNSPTTINFVTASSDPVFNGTTSHIDVLVVDNECGAWGYLAGDLNHDCKVDMSDLRLLASTWLNSRSVPTVASGSGDTINYAFVGRQEVVKFYDNFNPANAGWVVGGVRTNTKSGTFAGGDWFAIEDTTPTLAKATIALGTPINMSAGDVVMYNTMKTSGPNTGGDNNRVQIEFGKGGRISLYPSQGDSSLVGDAGLDPYLQHGYVMYTTSDANTIIYGNDGTYNTTESYLSVAPNGATIGAIPMAVWPDENTYVQLATVIHYTAGGSGLPAGMVGTISMTSYYYDQVTNPLKPQWKSLGSADKGNNNVKWVVNSTTIGELTVSVAAFGDNYTDQATMVGSVALTQLTYSTPLAGDVDLNGKVNFVDFAKMAAEWMQCTTPFGVNCVAGN